MTMKKLKIAIHLTSHKINRKRVKVHLNCVSFSDLHPAVSRYFYITRYYNEMYDEREMRFSCLSSDLFHLNAAHHRLSHHAVKQTFLFCCSLSSRFSTYLQGAVHRSASAGSLQVILRKSLIRRPHIKVQLQTNRQTCSCYQTIFQSHRMETEELLSTHK
ncbi:CLUMA_CG000507, isoform A [Clunio marinus]|uniref:CLUMA_CG000507, isoform A n=1 Tax=Clunio marinus TaxID=568069 RepID=A0A1J1HFC7_9DIPT|nr:CLUMA_CG000507, isoform A [Clunio marinus]